MEESRKHALLFSATILAARQLAALDRDKPSMRRKFIIEEALSDAEHILEIIDHKHPTPRHQKQQQQRVSPLNLRTATASNEAEDNDDAYNQGVRQDRRAARALRNQAKRQHPNTRV